MGTTTTNRRDALKLLGQSVALSAIPALAIGAAKKASAGTINRDPKWDTLLAEYRRTHADFLLTLSVVNEAQARYFEALKEYPEPVSPKSDLAGLTLAQIARLAMKPYSRAAFDAYEADHKAWRAKRHALCERIVGAADKAHDEAANRHSYVCHAIKVYPVSSLPILLEKAELIAAEYGDHDGISSEFVADIRRIAQREA